MPKVDAEEVFREEFRERHSRPRIPVRGGAVMNGEWIARLAFELEYPGWRWDALPEAERRRWREKAVPSEPREGEK